MSVRFGVRRAVISSATLATVFATCALGAALAPTPAGATVTACPADGSVQSQSFTEGAVGSYSVPAGITNLKAVATGGRGATAEGQPDDSAAIGGAGARVTADLDVSGGDSLSVSPGSNADGDLGGPTGNSSTSGGNGTFAPGADTDYGQSGGGGGSSFISKSGTVLVAAGGGGGAGFSDANGGGPTTGSFLAGTVADGNDGADGSHVARSGDGGTSSPGSGGDGATAAQNGKDGSGEIGGDSGAADGLFAGGAGGGGYAGGGAGGSAADGGSAGGAGSSYSATAYSVANGTSPGVVISYQCPTITSSDEADFTVNTESSFMITTTGDPAPTITMPGALPTGLVFHDNGDGTATISGTPAPGTGGNIISGYTVTADNGDGAAAQQDFTIQVDPATPTISVQDLDPTPTVGATDTIETTVTGFSDTDLPTGSVQIEGDSSNAIICTGDLTVVSGVPTFDCTTPPLIAGDGFFIAFFTSTNTDYDSGQNFTDVDVPLADTTIGLQSSIASPTFGDEPTITASLSPTGRSGTVQFAVDGHDDGGPVTPTSDQAVSTDLTNTSDQPLSAGDHTVTATFNPTDTNDYNTEVQSLDLDIAKAATSTSVEQELADPVYGQQPTAGALISPMVAGTVQFSVDGNDVGSPVTVASGEADSPGLTGPSDALLPAGDHDVGAVFTPSDPTDYVGSSNDLMIPVGKASTSTKVAVLPHSIFAAVAPVAPGAGNPTGSVDFSVDGTSVGTGTVTNGIAAIAYTVPSGATHAVAASYSGDDNFLTSLVSTNRNDPTITATVHSTKPKTAAGWYSKPVTVTFHCTTNGADLKKPCPSPVTLSRNGAAQSVSRSILAKDGGAAMVTVSPINIDQTPPIVAVKGANNAATYDGTAPKARCVATDSLSGVATCKLIVRGTGGHLTLVAKATNNAGLRATAKKHITILNPYIAGTKLHNGAFTTKIDHGYTLVAISNTQPHYLFATPANTTHPDNIPNSAGPTLTNIGGHKWSITVDVTKAMAARYHLWNLGVRFGGQLHIVQIHLVS